MTGMELTQDLIKRRSKQFDIGCITLLDLSNAGLSRLGDLDDCVNVIKLNLSNNEISDLDGLPGLFSLLSLDLSGNRLSTIVDLPRYPTLEELILSDNLIESVDFKALALKVPRLRKLHLERNPVEIKDTFTAKIRLAFPNLLTLNGEALAFFEALSVESQAPTPSSMRNDAPQSMSSPAILGVAFKLPPFEAEKFARETTARLEQMLREASQTLETESARVEQAFRALSV